MRRTNETLQGNAALSGPADSEKLRQWRQAKRPTASKGEVAALQSLTVLTVHFIRIGAIHVPKIGTRKKMTVL